MASFVNKVVSGIGNVYDGLEKRVKSRKSHQLLPIHIKEWLAEVAEQQQAAEFKALAKWLQTLPSIEAELFSKQLIEFCNVRNFNVLWLVENNLEDDLALKEVLEQAVLSFGVAYWHTAQVQDDLQAFILLREWLNAPNKSEHSQLTQQLFTKLIEQGLTDSPPASLFLASESERQIYIVDAIGKVVEQDKQAVMATLKILNRNEGQIEPTLLAPTDEAKATADTVEDIVEKTKEA